MWRKIIRDFAASKGVAQRKVGDAEILERCTYPMINEGAKILAEGKAQRASDIDIVWVYGYGWPVYRGGPMFYADTVGLKTVLDKLSEFAGEIWRRLQAGAAAGEAGGRRQELHAMTALSQARTTPSPSGGRWRAEGATDEGGRIRPAS